MSDKKKPEPSKTDIDASIPNDSADKKTTSSTATSNSSKDNNTVAAKAHSNPSTNTSAATTKNSDNKVKTSAKAKANEPALVHQKAPAQKQTNAVSKVAIVALIIALIALLASIGHFFWLEQQKQQRQQQLTSQLAQQVEKVQQQMAAQLQASQRQAMAQLATTQQNNSQAISQLASAAQQEQQLASESLKAIAQLQQQVSKLGQTQASDWLLLEAEYLIRLAARVLWLEKNTNTAISLLTDADLRIAELNDPQYLPLRQSIQQDIAQLELLPTLNTDNAMLKLMALEQQISQLPLLLFEVPEQNSANKPLELTDNVDDWRQNLAKTWRKFLDEYFTITRRSGNIEPLMSAEFQQNLRENLSLKLQTAIWAASKANHEIYLQALNDVQRWLQDYFDNTKPLTLNFIDAIEQLKTATISVDYPNGLPSLTLIRAILSSKEKVAPAIEAPLTPDETPSAEQGEGN
ncbi:uroporphyrin-3 C-methyltransferase [Colwellia chukchiensis]|uniref:Uroporphyrin-3 C-methyltransferase n=1 Tax=Colwellia chukchiensis TaxID=641665 RepID=A0A1H7P7A1_9GAMM|nr:uroporphyrinogen-III C-methyltransferase [Colwellia chukchiensis]SEL31633.1 uroporphyrin-3 C-methyltransferase [Colwellia chukchiensis]